MNFKKIEFDGHPFYLLQNHLTNLSHSQWDGVKSGYYLADKWEKYAIDNILDNLEPDWNFVDAGANWGAYSALVAHRTKGKVYAFEPHPDNYKVLCKNTKGLSNVITYNKALGKTNRNAQLFLSKKGHGGHSLRILRSTNTTKCQVIRLDDLNLNVDAMKIDVEGNGYALIQGAENTLKNIKLIVFEVHVGEEQRSSEYLSQRGFQCVFYNRYSFIAKKM